MSLQFVGLKEINGPLVVLDHVPDVSFEEMVELTLEDGTTRAGRVVQIQGEQAIIQVFEGTRGLSLKNTRTKFLAHPMEMPLAKEILGMGIVYLSGIRFSVSAALVGHILPTMLLSGAFAFIIYPVLYRIYTAQCMRRHPRRYWMD